MNTKLFTISLVAVLMVVGGCDEKKNPAAGAGGAVGGAMKDAAGDMKDTFTKAEEARLRKEEEARLAEATRLKEAEETRIAEAARTKEAARLAAEVASRNPKLGDSFTNSIGATMVFIAPGTFTMGTPATEENHGADEAQHRVTLTRGF